MSHLESNLEQNFIQALENNNVKEWLLKGGNPNFVSYGNTALHIATHDETNTQPLEELIAAGADLTTLDNFSENPFNRAIKAPNFKAFEILFKAGIEKKLPDSYFLHGLKSAIKGEDHVINTGFEPGSLNYQKMETRFLMAKILKEKLNMSKFDFLDLVIEKNNSILMYSQAKSFRELFFDHCLDMTQKEEREKAEETVNKIVLNRHNSIGCLSDFLKSIDNPHFKKSKYSLNFQKTFFNAFHVLLKEPKVHEFNETMWGKLSLLDFGSFNLLTKNEEGLTLMDIMEEGKDKYEQKWPQFIKARYDEIKIQFEKSLIGQHKLQSSHLTPFKPRI